MLRERPKRKKGEVRIATYLVFQRKNLFAEGEPNVAIVAAKLTRRGAEEIVAAMAGTYIEKVMAIK